jgi:hypothetical protein
MRDTVLLKSGQGENRTRYSLRYVDAAFELLGGAAARPSPSNQLGNSAAMIEQRDSRLPVRMGADRLVRQFFEFLN